MDQTWSALYQSDIYRAAYDLRWSFAWPPEDDLEKLTLSRLNHFKEGDKYMYRFIARILKGTGNFTKNC